MMGDPGDNGDAPAVDNASPVVENLLLLPDMLRRAGLPLSLEQTLSFLRALTWMDIGDRDQVFYTARALLVVRSEHLRLFETIFNGFWTAHRQIFGGRGQKAPVAPRHDGEEKKRFNIVTYMAYKARRFDPEIEVADKSASYSATELLQQKDFSLLTPSELETVKRLIAALRWRASERETRRLVPRTRGAQLDFRRVLKKMAQHGGVALELPRRGPKIKQRPVVLLADISGSMEKFSRLVLQFFYSISRGLGDVESFLFGTRLTRITPQLEIRNIDRAIDQAARQVIDWSGGTRIGESLHVFNRQWSRRVLRRGAIVLILSDGWERGDVSVLRQEMAYLQRRCHRLIWLNPLLGKGGYQPLALGMAAALPHVDDFLPVHNLAALEQLADVLAGLPSGRCGGSSHGVQDRWIDRHSWPVDRPTRKP